LVDLRVSNDVRTEESVFRNQIGEQEPLVITYRVIGRR